MAKIASAEAKVAAIKDDQKRAAAEASLRAVEYAFKRVDHIVSNTVAEIAQTAAVDSNLSADEKKARLELALTRIKHQIPERLTKVLSGVVNDFDRYLITKIEATRFQQKQLKG